MTLNQNFEVTQSAEALMAFTGGLKSRTFIGLLIAQFLAAFNDQAIHAAAMFYAINTLTMPESEAISLMPILFYAPWAIFCTVAGWLADRFSKRQALIIWKIAEVIITGVALIGFYLGRNGGEGYGPWIVLATVFLMGTHSAFFVPAKYGIMPEILPPHQLSRGNGILESLSFLAVILGTVSGGVLSFMFLGREWIIGVILLGLAIVGAVASFLIRKVPAANPFRPFPKYVYLPLWQSLKSLLATRALRLAIVGIAFFTFVVAFMRAAVYMLGESQNPRWDELKTSMIVGTVALGIGLGSPLAGLLSGRRVELRLVLVGAVGMIALLIAAGVMIDRVPILVACIVGIGFFTGFYIVPLFTLLQHKAPKSSKGEMIAMSNFINVTGAIAASLLFFLVVLVVKQTGVVPQVSGRETLGSGELKSLTIHRGRPVYFEVQKSDGSVITPDDKPAPPSSLTFKEISDNILGKNKSEAVLELTKDIKPPEPGAPQRVAVSKFTLNGVVHYDLVLDAKNPDIDYDLQHLPRYLFLGAALLTIALLLTITRPLFAVRREGT